MNPKGNRWNKRTRAACSASNYSIKTIKCFSILAIIDVVIEAFNSNVFIAGRSFSDKVDRLKLAEIVKQAIEEKTNLQDSP